MEIIHLGKLVRTMYVCSTLYTLQLQCICDEKLNDNHCSTTMAMVVVAAFVDVVAIAIIINISLALQPLVLSLSCCYYANRYFTTEFMCTVWHNLYCIFPFIKSNWTINWNLFLSRPLSRLSLSHSIALFSNRNCWSPWTRWLMIEQWWALLP